jgi:hypothetical protein
MKQKIIYALVTLAILLLGVVMGVKLADYQHKKTSDKAFNAGLKISNQVKLPGLKPGASFCSA